MKTRCSIRWPRTSGDARAARRGIVVVLITATTFADGSGASRRERRSSRFPGFVPAFVRPLFCKGSGRSAGLRSSGANRRTIAVTAGNRAVPRSSFSRQCAIAGAWNRSVLPSA
jgi:hypothetical protein